MKRNVHVNWLTTLFGTGKGSEASVMMFLLGAAGTIMCLLFGHRLKRYQFHEE